MSVFPKPECFDRGSSIFLRSVNQMSCVPCQLVLHMTSGRCFGGRWKSRLESASIWKKNPLVGHKSEKKLLLKVEREQNLNALFVYFSYTSMNLSNHLLTPFWWFEFPLTLCWSTLENDNLLLPFWLSKVKYWQHLALCGCSIIIVMSLQLPNKSNPRVVQLDACPLALVQGAEAQRQNRFFVYMRGQV